MAKPLVSVISISYNREDFVAASVQSLLDQTYENLEIIIIDDGSSDRTFERLSEFFDPRLTVMTHENRGFVRSVRRAIEMSKGEYIAVHGFGDISLSRRIERQAALLQEKRHVGLVGCFLLNVNTYNDHAEPHEPTIPDDVTQTLKRTNFFTHGEVMYRRELYERVGGYREFFKYAQDRDLWLRMSKHAEFAVVEELLYKRFMLSDGVELNLEKRSLQGYLADFAGQCMTHREKSGHDLLDLYGEHAPFFRQPSRALSRKLHTYSTYALLRKDMDLAGRMNRMSLCERREVRNSLLQGLLFFIGSSKVLTNTFFYLLLKLRNLNRLAKRAN